MKRIKLLSALLIAALLASFFAFPASAASSSVSTVYSTYQVGNNIQVTVTINSEADIGAWDLTLSYNANLVTYLSGADSGGGGVVRFVNTNNGAGHRSLQVSAMFSAKAIGSAAFSLTVNKLLNFETMGGISCSGGSRTVQIIPVPEASSVNTLSALQVSPGELTPAFSPSVTEYTVTLPYEKNAIAVSATPTDGKARVSVRNTDLEVGENVIPVTVTAENGNVRTYTLRVTRQASEFAGASAVVDGQEWNFGYDPSEIEAPDGFSPSSSSYEGQKILTYESQGEEKVTIVYLSSEEESRWFLFDPETGSFSPFISLPRRADALVILPLPEEAQAPEGYEVKEVSYGDETFTAFCPLEAAQPLASAAEAPEIGAWVVYGLNVEGKVGYYYFDPENGNFFPYFAASAPSPEGSEPLPGEPANTADPRELELARERANKWEIAAMILGFVAEVLVIALVLALIFRRRGKNDPKDPDSQGGAPVEEKSEKEQKEEEDAQFDQALFPKE